MTGFRFFSVFFSIATALTVLTPACRHELATNTPVDGGNGGNGGGGGQGVPCDPDSVYFENDVLPLLVSNCAKSGCHDAGSHQDGIRLYSYETYRNTIDQATSSNPDRNEMLEVLLEDDPDKRMPPPPNAPLSNAQINLLVQWLQQGAQNNGCNENYDGCATEQVSWSVFIQPLVAQKCQGCHSGTAPGGGIKLTTYNEVKAIALSGQFHQVVTRAVNWMPKGGAKLDDCTTRKIKSWADAGAPQN